MAESSEWPSFFQLLDQHQPWRKTRPRSDHADHGKMMGVQWEFNGSSMGVQWEFNGNMCGNHGYSHFVPGYELVMAHLVRWFYLRTNGDLLELCQITTRSGALQDLMWIYHKHDVESRRLQVRQKVNRYQLLGIDCSLTNGPGWWYHRWIDLQPFPLS